MKLLNRYELNHIKSTYSKGSRVRLIDDIDDPHSKLKAGDEGVITHIDDIGTLHMKWDNGSSLGLIVGLDKFEII